MDKDLFFLVSLCLAHHRSESKQQGVGDITAPCWGMSRHFDRLYAKLHWASLIAQLVKNRQQCRRSRFGSIPEFRKIRWRRDRLPAPVFLGFPCGSAGKESTCNMGDLGSIPGLGRSPGAGKGYPLQYSGLQNSMDCIFHGIARSQTPLSDLYFHFHFLHAKLHTRRAEDRP